MIQKCIFEEQISVPRLLRDDWPGGRFVYLHLMKEYYSSVSWRELIFILQNDIYRLMNADYSSVG